MLPCNFSEIDQNIFSSHFLKRNVFFFFLLLVPVYLFIALTKLFVHFSLPNHVKCYLYSQSFLGHRLSWFVKTLKILVKILVFENFTRPPYHTRLKSTLTLMGWVCNVTKLTCYWSPLCLNLYL